MPQPSAESRYARLLTIAGSDSGGGAGIQADLKTFAALGCYGMSAITALTAQNTTGVRAIHATPPEFLSQQIDAVVEDIGVDAVKIGMLHSPEIVRTVAGAIVRHRLPNVVFDPVMVATSGARLIDEPAVEVLVKELFPRTSLVTPNLDEAALLVGFAIHDDITLQRAAERLIARGARAVLLKGGHLPGEDVVDLLLTADGSRQIWRASRIHSRNLHGTGCTLSSAIAAQLALGDDLVAAVGAARDYVRKAIESGAAVRTGCGHGPLDHGFAPRPMRKLPAQG
ncbi:bifunctional hydroxymethylpyrimidine kinase/phosphomethylpyrimidine kinase [Hydrocarboniphaga effusa]|uniref:bifunctional hydroxymethylpyrimidine kinase/phosphomethylpyrimidine kinase n=1 Tax=Hydrocarboniphaga effusa TaxID=243629 RepID=UPI00398C0E3B